MSFNARTEDGKIVEIVEKTGTPDGDILTDIAGNTYIQSLLNPMKLRLLKEAEQIVNAVVDKAVEEIEAVRETVTEMIEAEIADSEPAVEELAPDPEAA